MPSLAVTTEGVVRILAFARPERRNAFDLATMKRLRAAVAEALDDATVGALVLTGEGEAFSAGGDVREMAAAPDLRAHFLALTEQHHAVVAALRATGKPVVTAVPGVAAGGGFGLALAGDLRLAAPEARYVAAYLGLGVAPDGGLTWLLPRIAGRAVAERMLWGGEEALAARALEWGLAHGIVPRERLRAEAVREATRLAALPGEAFAAAKTLLDASASTTLEAQLDRERALNAATGAAAETQARVARYRR